MKENDSSLQREIMFPFRIRRRKFKTRMLSSFLVLSVILTFWMARQEFSYSQQKNQSNKEWNECVAKIQSDPSIELSNTTLISDDDNIYQTYRTKECPSIVQEYFSHPPPTQSELEFPIAFSISVYKSASLLEKLLQAIYMPQNLYCIHIDMKSTPTFCAAVTELIRCLPNVLLAKKSVDVIYPHISILHAQFNCMEDLLYTGKDWKYMINLVGQDFPLYNNRELVLALRALNGKNNIQSFHHPDLKRRTQYAYEFKRRMDGSDHKAYKPVKTYRKKSPPPYNITLFKGANHVGLTKGFVEYIIFNQTARDFIDWLSDTRSPPETFYSSLQQHPGVPGGVIGLQPEFVMRAIDWFDKEKDEANYECHGKWVRQICWISVRDLRWVLGWNKRNMLFVQKIPFDVSEDLLRCLSIARERRVYGSYFFMTRTNFSDTSYLRSDVEKEMMERHESVVT
ncbi:beta-1,3-galactosyl-O-glycosyl-glycoprotein beta-1,6-N-acetylglucosaminyltransferase 4-like isoform X1 [Stylophora pistillata]|uniref:beta-1,3-galactosyl-O-glycosyl-glycoprotein beta-1,6-N-acetylglucosaminyltransferase 4-like isoform X1 n=1 Tax=Stylophora pistillata TaxID=50429 RepID=UPI000C03E432|nr:beta-1,3-galactosyl-O-glycosyl-glycoprotein beta-1,6-N-acetylglucosaminyltransferase 4-like isoform X1 [Stylophora pistillata]